MLPPAAKHHKKADQKQSAGKPYHVISKPSGKIPSNPRPDGKNQDNAKIMEGFLQLLRFLFPKISGKRLRAAPQVSDTHGTGISVTVDLPEGLHLHGAA